MFENTTTYDKAAVWSMTCVSVRRFRRKRYLLRKCFYVGLGLLGTICGLLLLMIFWTLDYGERLVCVMVLATCVPSLLKGLFLRRFMAWSAGRVLRGSMSLRECHFTFLQEAFHCAQSGIETTYPYETVEEVCETERHFILRLDKESGIILDKAGFSRGTPEEFRAWITARTGRAAAYVK